MELILREKTVVFEDLELIRTETEGSLLISAPDFEVTALVEIGSYNILKSCNLDEEQICIIYFVLSKAVREWNDEKEDTVELEVDTIPGTVAICLAMANGNTETLVRAFLELKNYQIIEIFLEGNFKSFQEII